MASHHHHHYQQQQYQNSNYPSCHCCCCTSNPSSFHHPSPPSPPPPPPPSLQSSHLHATVVDPLLVQSITAQILQSSQNHHLFTQYLEQQPKKQHKQQQQTQTRSLLTSLLRRIDVLESSLHKLSVSPSPSPPPPPLSIRELAARTIQTHFRAFLVRRSRTLRNLKYLAFIKSSFNSLKSSLSGNNNVHVDHPALSQKAMDLLLKLDSVQGGDPMIRDGKRSISRELIRFLEFVDGFSVKRQLVASKGIKNVRLGEGKQGSRVFINTDRRDLGSNHHRVYLKKKLSDQDQEIEGFCRVSEDDEESQLEFQGFHPIINDKDECPRNFNHRNSEISQSQNGISFKPKKSVSFANNGKVSKVFVSTLEPSSSEDGDSSIDQVRVSGDDDDQRRELVENLCREVEEIGGFSRVSEEDDDDDDEEETQLEKRGLTQVSDDDERNPREYVKTEVNNGFSRHFQNENGSFVFSPPVPVQMEPRMNDLMKRKIVR